MDNQNDNLSRRSFITMAGFAAAGSLFAAKKSNDPGVYSVAVLGDTHFDGVKPREYHRHYTAGGNAKAYKAHYAEFVRNGVMWKRFMPSLMKASASCVTPDTAFVLQLGDLIQGDCDDVKVHNEMLSDMFKYVSRIYGKDMPFVTVVGNHDIRGKGALGVYDEVVPPLMAKQIKQPVNKTTFHFRQGPDVFICIDFNAPRPDIRDIIRILDETRSARHTFVVCHGPVIPSCSSLWYLYGHPSYAAQRLRLRSLLAQRNAIVLSGHTHCIEYYDCKFPEGRITQFVANSVWASKAGAPLRIIDEGPELYGKRMPFKNGMPANKHLEKLTHEYRRSVQEYLFAGGAGHYRLNVSDVVVSIDFYEGDSKKPSRKFILRGKGFEGA